MKSVKKPLINAKTAFQACIKIVKNPDLKQRLTACENLIIKAEKEFDTKVATENIHSIQTEDIVNGNVTAEELEKVYTLRMVKKDVPGRSIYDKLISAPKLGICPLCSHRSVETLDHYLPKTDFPRLSTTPINLVPSCFSCNKSKLRHIPSNPEEATLHPYYDNIEDEEWLFAKVNHTDLPSISYFVTSPENWTDLLKGRVKFHFKLLSLDKLYSTQAAVLIRGLSHRLDSIYKKLSSNGVKDYLNEEANSRYAYDKNSWQTVFYLTASKDDWFCNGGFKIN